MAGPALTVSGTAYYRGNDNFRRDANLYFSSVTAKEMLVQGTAWKTIVVYGRLDFQGISIELDRQHQCSRDGPSRGRFSAQSTLRTSTTSAPPSGPVSLSTAAIPNGIRQQRTREQSVKVGTLATRGL